MAPFFMPTILILRLLTQALPLLTAVTGSAMAECTPPRLAETVTVRYVHDGDTLILHDERKLRLLGYNSPEVARRERPAEPLALQAREQLTQLIEGSGRQIQLQYDVERKDRYGRTLAHAFLRDGRSITEQMLQTGLATSLIIPPNLHHADCYSEAGNRAQKRKQGVWSLPAYQPVDWAKLKTYRDRYTVLQGIVSELEQETSGFSFWLRAHEDAPRVRVFIAAADLELFRQMRLKTLTGRKIEVRGWLHRRDKMWTLQLRHPSNIDLL